MLFCEGNVLYRAKILILKKWFYKGDFLSFFGGGIIKESPLPQRPSLLSSYLKSIGNLNLKQEFLFRQTRQQYICCGILLQGLKPLPLYSEFLYLLFLESFQSSSCKIKHNKTKQNKK